jgi:methylase of polypeptide subunit release factors
MDAKCLALTTLGLMLRSEGYQFVAITPATHRLVIDRLPGPTTLQSIFGWNRPFERDAIDEGIFNLLIEADALAEKSGRYKSTVRFATIGDLLFVHSGFPTVEQDAVFFGPDTYRFARLLRSSLADLGTVEPLRLVDIGSGSGAGGIIAARLLGQQTDLVLADINRKALEFSAINAAVNELPARTMFSDVFEGIEGGADIIVANPPYLVDDEKRLYRHGGGELGIALALRIAEQSLTRLSPGGRLILYTGTPIIEGTDPFFRSLLPLLQLQTSQFSYEEIDPDVFGEELSRHAYLGADRIAAVGLTVIK